MGSPYYHLSPYLLISFVAAFQGCSTGIETATSNGTSSGQAISSTNSTSISKETTASTSDSKASVTGGDKKSSTNGAQTTSGNGGNNIATPPANIAGKALGNADPSTIGNVGNNIATAPGNIAGSLEGDLPGVGWPTSGISGGTVSGGMGGFAPPPGDFGGTTETGEADGSYGGSATAGSEIGVSAMTDPTAQNGRTAVDPTTIAGSSGSISTDRWTDTGNVNNLILQCSGSASFGGNVWQSICSVGTTNGTELDLVHETTNRQWTVTAAVGCNPQKSELASLGTTTHLSVSYVGPVIASCVPATTVKLQATSHRGQSFTLIKTLTR